MERRAYRLRKKPESGLCPQGHDDWAHYPTTGWVCKVCRNEYQTAYRERKRKLKEQQRKLMRTEVLYE